MTHPQSGDPARRSQLPPPAIPPQFGHKYPQPGPYQQSQQPQFQPAYQQPPQYAPQPPRGSRKGWAAIGCLGVGGLFVLIAALGASRSSQSPAATAPAAGTQAAAPAQSTPAARAAAPKTVATFTGSGTQKTAQFTVTSTWALSYAFDCSSFGYKGNFQVFTDGGSDFSGVTVNDLAMSKSAVTYAYNDAGTHYLEVSSECSWTVKVIDQG